MERGFTFIELLVVIALIGLFATVVLLNVGDTRAEARDAQRLSDVQDLAVVIQQYRLGEGSLPSSLQDLVDASYMGQLPTDPTSGTDYNYVQNSTGFKVWSNQLEARTVPADSEFDGCPSDCTGCSSSGIAEDDDAVYAAYSGAGRCL